MPTSAARVEDLLEPGEQLVAAIPGLSGQNPSLRFLSGLLVINDRPRLVVVTDRRVLICSASMWRPSVPKAVLGSADCDTPLTHTHHGWSKLVVGDHHAWVRRKFYPQLDRLAAAGTAGATGSAAAILSSPGDEAVAAGT